MQFRRKFDLSMFGISVKHQLNGRLFSLHWSQLCTSHTVDKSRRMNFIPWHLLSEPDEIFFFLEAEFNLQTISCGRIPIFPATRSTVFDVCYFVKTLRLILYTVLKDEKEQTFHRKWSCGLQVLFLKKFLRTSSKFPAKNSLWKFPGCGATGHFPALAVVLRDCIGKHELIGFIRSGKSGRKVLNFG